MRGETHSRWIALVASLAALPLAALGCSLFGSQRRPHILLITIDTLRADHVSIYGAAKAKTPHLDALGREGYINQYMDLGQTSEDVLARVDYGEFARKNQTRVVAYPHIGELIGLGQPLLAFYEELCRREIGEKDIQGFLTDSVTLLAVFNEFLTGNTIMVMALKEETEIPFDTYHVDM